MSRIAPQASGLAAPTQRLRQEKAQGKFRILSEFR
jgi:hypothetical protein